MRNASLLGLVFLMACSSDDKSSSSGNTTTGGQQPTDAQVQGVLDNYATNLFQAYSDTVTDEATFSTKVDAFLASPSDATLTAARDGWLESRAHYMLLEGARFYDGPIDVDPPNHEAALNSWPLDEAYVDYTTDKATNAVDETQGLVNHADLLPTITVDAIDAKNAEGGDENISNGYHAQEFLLWGQALKDVGPGERPFTDYQSGGPRKNVDRRSAYLKTVTASVTQHLTAVRDAWAPTAEYRKTFTSGGKASIAIALTGLGKLSKGELAGERINAPYASKSRRDQHNCFSSTTLTDYERDARGILAMYQGKYGSNTTGPGLDSLVRLANPDVDTRLTAQLQASIDAIVAIPKPFEASIVGDDNSEGRTKIRAAVESLRKQGDLFAEAAAALGLTIQVPEEN